MLGGRSRGQGPPPTAGEKPSENQSSDLRKGGRVGVQGKTLSQASQPPGEGAILSGGDQHGSLGSAAATSASPAQGAVPKQEEEAAPCRTAQSAASLPGTPSPACRPHQTYGSGAPTTSIPQGESTAGLSGHLHPWTTPSFVRLGMAAPTLTQTTGELTGPNPEGRFSLRMKWTKNLSWQQ